jgi:Trk K+ transport system NAD-binding subunit
VGNPLLAFWYRLFDRVDEDAARPGSRRAGQPLPVTSVASASSTIFLILRRMRAPLIVLIAVYAISVLGLTLIPGQDGSGNPWRMGFFHAFYFMSYTATTIGFGEIPYAFTDAQRLWVTVSIYLTVIGWAYAIGSMLALLQDRGFRQALELQRFARRVRRLSEPFLLIAGYGHTGQLLGRSLDALGRRFVVLDVAGARIDELELESFRFDAPGLVADARNPQHLALAGLGHRYCEGVIALTNDDEVNLAVTMAAAALNPGLTVIARTVRPPIAERMRAFGQPFVINPFDRFGDHLRTALRAPASFRLIEWLTGVPGTELPPRREPPRGRWVVCGFGKFGREIAADLRAENLAVTIIEPGAAAADDPSIIVGFGTEPEVLARADVANAVGLVAATDNDTSNLSVIAAARSANPDLFVIARQNEESSAALFGALNADFVLVPAEVIAHEVLARISTPMLMRFLDAVPGQGDAWAARLVARLTERCGQRVPALWRVRITRDEAPALLRGLDAGGITLGTLLRNPDDRERALEAVPLLLLRGNDMLLAPEDDIRLERGDAIVFAGRPSARRSLEATLFVDATREYLVSGRHVPASWVWRRLAREREA